MTQQSVIKQAAKNYREYPLLDNQMGEANKTLVKRVFHLVMSQEALIKSINGLAEDGYDMEVGGMLKIFTARLKAVEDELKAMEAVHGKLTETQFRT